MTPKACKVSSIVLAAWALLGLVGGCGAIQSGKEVRATAREEVAESLGIQMSWELGAHPVPTAPAIWIGVEELAVTTSVGERLGGPFTLGRRPGRERLAFVLQPLLRDESVVVLYPDERVTALTLREVVAALRHVRTVHLAVGTPRSPRTYIIDPAHGERQLKISWSGEQMRAVVQGLTGRKTECEREIFSGGLALRTGGNGCTLARPGTDAGEVLRGVARVMCKLASDPIPATITPTRHMSASELAQVIASLRVPGGCVSRVYTREFGYVASERPATCLLPYEAEQVVDGRRTPQCLLREDVPGRWSVRDTEQLTEHWWSALERASTDQPRPVTYPTPTGLPPG